MKRIVPTDAELKTYEAKLRSRLAAIGQEKPYYIPWRNECLEELLRKYFDWADLNNSGQLPEETDADRFSLWLCQKYNERT